MGGAKINNITGQQNEIPMRPQEGARKHYSLPETTPSVLLPITSVIVPLYLIFTFFFRDLIFEPATFIYSIIIIALFMGVIIIIFKKGMAYNKELIAIRKLEETENREQLKSFFKDLKSPDNKKGEYDIVTKLSGLAGGNALSSSFELLMVRILEVIDLNNSASPLIIKELSPSINSLLLKTERIPRYFCDLALAIGIFGTFHGLMMTFAGGKFTTLTLQIFQKGLKEAIGSSLVAIFTVIFARIIYGEFIGLQNDIKNELDRFTRIVLFPIFQIDKHTIEIEEKAVIRITEQITQFLREDLGEKTEVLSEAGNKLIGAVDRLETEIRSMTKRVADFLATNISASINKLSEASQGLEEASNGIKIRVASISADIGEAIGKELEEPVKSLADVTRQLNESTLNLSEISEKIPEQIANEVTTSLTELYKLINYLKVEITKIPGETGERMASTMDGTLKGLENNIFSMKQSIDEYRQSSSKYEESVKKVRDKEGDFVRIYDEKIAKMSDLFSDIERKLSNLSGSLLDSVAGIKQHIDNSSRISENLAESIDSLGSRISTMDSIINDTNNSLAGFISSVNSLSDYFASSKDALARIIARNQTTSQNMEIKLEETLRQIREERSGR